LGVTDGRNSLQGNMELPQIPRLIPQWLLWHYWSLGLLLWFFCFAFQCYKYYLSLYLGLAKLCWKFLGRSESHDNDVPCLFCDLFSGPRWDEGHKSSTGSLSHDQQSRAQESLNNKVFGGRRASRPQVCPADWEAGLGHLEVTRETWNCTQLQVGGNQAGAMTEDCGSWREPAGGLRCHTLTSRSWGGVIRDLCCPSCPSS
jgi:hypothetical protein